MRTSDMGNIFKGLVAVGLIAVLAACGSGLSSMSSTGTGSSKSSGGSNNTPPGIPNSILFVSSSSNTIGLQGTGATPNAQVTFQVDDSSGAGVGGIAVTFTLKTATGGASLTTTTGTTGANGQVSTTVVSGNVHESITVEASVTTPSGVKTADSNKLAVSTGIPTQGRFGISVSNLTANNANNTLGVTDTVTILLADRFGNAPPDGTAVSFVTNEGKIDPQCITVNGICTAVWTSSGLNALPDTFHERGQAEILAYTVGEETFTDVDGDGVFDNSDLFTTFKPGDVDTFAGNNPLDDDIGEVYMDGGGAGQYVSGDFPVDFNNDGVRNPPDGKFHGFGCKGTPTVPCGTSTVGIGRQICVNMSTSGAIIGVSATSISMGAGPTSKTVQFTLSDVNGHALASGTQVTLVTAGLSAGITVNPPTNLPFNYPDVGCGPDTRTFVVTIAEAAPATPPVPAAGTIQLKVVTPGTGGAETDSAVVNIGP